MKKQLISIIIPAYNEEQVIFNSLTAIEKQLKSMKRPFNILVVNDGSNDKTLRIVKDLIKKKRYKNIQIISYKDGPLK